jgi:hypothetical protein
MGELRDKFSQHYIEIFNVAVCRIFGLPSSRILSTLRSPTACASYHLSVQAMRGAFASAGVDMSDDAWASAFNDHLARYGGGASVHIANSWLVTALAEIIYEVRGALMVGVEVLTYPNGNSPTATTASPRMWVSCNVTVSEAQNLLLMLWFPVVRRF